MRTVLLIATVLSLLLATSLASSRTPGTEPPVPPEAPPQSGPATGPAVTEVPPLPRPSIADPEQAAQYAAALESLEKGAYGEARSAFRKLRAQAKDEVLSAVERCLLEAEGGLDLEKATEAARKSARRAYVVLGKVMERYVGTLVGLEIEARFQQLYDEIYFTVADFEQDAASAAGAPEDDGAGGEGATPQRGANRGYGANTRVVEGTPEARTVRGGKHALLWRTGPGLSTVNLTAVQGKAADYRYLNLALRTDDPQERPNLVLLFDCLEWQGDGEGPGRGRGARMGGAWVLQRDGFSTTVNPSGDWQDLRLDLRKFVAKGNASWNDVVALRIVHMPGVSATVRIDEVRLEKE